MPDESEILHYDGPSRISRNPIDTTAKKNYTAAAADPKKLSFT